ncbi:cytochrome P450 [Aspergillus affinis]|uniref:cytochrome P450 n=1 Tax=Aspergillus affinis TaxID=1070780 RepID=UPI0022FE617A|nr:putative O-methylsterigmatocystin oxidoreductase [Aspergillus affinis]KAI9039424.1 putative O-methylsterigmatocystin oxidoreductase [Aspergillus affinis]
MDSFKMHDLHIPATALAVVLKPSTIVGLVCVFLISQLLLFAARYSKTSMAGIPGPSGWPLVGIGLDLPTRPRELLNKWAARYGDTFKVRVGWYDWVFFNNRDAVKEIFDRQAAVTSGKPHLPIAQEYCLRGHGVLPMTYSAKWKRLHYYLKQLLSPRASAAFIPSQEFEIKQLLSDLSGEAGKDSTEAFYMHIRRMTFSIVMTSAYGLRIPKWDCQEVRDVYGNMRMLSIILRPGIFWIDTFPPLNWLPRFLFPSWPKAKVMASIMHNAKMRHWENLKERIAQGTAPECFAKDLMESNYRDFGLEEEAMSWLASAVPEAGAETTASALNGMIRYLASFPDAQAAAHEEVTRVLGNGRMATLDDEPNMPYIRAVIKETLRLCPVATTGLRRMTDADIRYRDQTIPKGTILLANINNLHWDPAFFDEPFKFKPERYLNHPHRSAVYAAGGDVMARDHFTFGAGRRICPGIHLAENGLFLAVANIIWAYEFRPPIGANGKEQPLDISDEGFMEGAIRVPQQYSIRILQRNPERAETVRRQWQQAQEDGYVLRGIHVDAKGGVKGGVKKAPK